MVDGLHPSLKGYEVWADGLEADPHGAARPAGRHRPRSAAHGRSECGKQADSAHRLLMGSTRGAQGSPGRAASD